EESSNQEIIQLFEKALCIEGLYDGLEAPIMDGQSLNKKVERLLTKHKDFLEFVLIQETMRKDKICRDMKQRAQDIISEKENKKKQNEQKRNSLEGKDEEKNTHGSTDNVAEEVANTKIVPIKNSPSSTPSTSSLSL